MHLALCTFNVLFFYILVIKLVFHFCRLCGTGQNIDEKYDQCILYFLRRFEFVNLVTYWIKVKSADVNKLAIYYAPAPTLLFKVCGILNQPES